jgi:hypothetical protein
VRTLDDVIGDRPVRGVKIDVEGAERLVLDGARETLASGAVTVFQLEWNRLSERLLGEDRVPVVTLLESYGYGFFRPDADGRLRPVDARPFGPDVFAVRGDPAEL